MDVRDDRASAISDAHTAITPIAGKGVLVTGGTTGIGRAIARLLAAEGAKVFSMRIGTLAERADLPPQRQIWCEAALPWTRDLLSLPKIEKQS